MEELIFFMTIPVVQDRSSHDEVYDVCIPRGVTRDCKEMLVGECVTNLSSSRDVDDGYYVAYKPITLPCILFVFIEMKFIHCHSCVVFAMKSMSMCND